VLTDSHSFPNYLFSYFDSHTFYPQSHSFHISFILPSSTPFDINTVAIRMCVTIDEICPWCKALTGDFTTVSCRHLQCDKKETVRRVLRVSDLRDWYCTTEGCEYSQQEQENQDQTIRDILVAQYKKSGESSNFPSRRGLQLVQIVPHRIAPFC
jgi:hypothetical protein